MNHQNNTYTTLKGKYHVNILRKGKPRYPHASTMLEYKSQLTKIKVM